MKNGKRRKNRHSVPNVRSLDEIIEYRKWARIRKWKYMLSSLLVVPIGCIIMGYLLVVGHFVNTDSAKRVAGAVSIDGIYESIRYVYIRSSSYYEIKLCGSNERYVISDILFKGFDNQLFSEKMKPGMPITLIVSLKNTPSDKTPVYAVSSVDFSFLSVDDTIKLKEENNRYTLPIGVSLMIIGFVSVLIVLIFMYLRLRSIRSDTRV